MQHNEKEDLTDAIRDGIQQAKQKEGLDMLKGCGCVIALIIIGYLCLGIFLNVADI